MPNRYQREIEEILRNMDQTEPKHGLSDRLRRFNQPRPTRERRPPTIKLTRAEALILLGILLALVAAALTFYSNKGAGLVTGVIATVAFALIALAIIGEWIVRFRGPRGPKTWRGNIVEMRPHTRNPFTFIVTRYRIIKLRLRYRRTRGREE
ncbi:MAG TPA: hypothetical protein VJN88_14225 [Ktedonobacterales bacterium]|nr:hypothetical protein [Ktedonobacterales bacterium]